MVAIIEATVKLDQYPTLRIYIGVRQGVWGRTRPRQGRTMACWILNCRSGWGKDNPRLSPDTHSRPRPPCIILGPLGTPNHPWVSVGTISLVDVGPMDVMGAVDVVGAGGVVGVRGRRQAPI